MKEKCRRTVCKRKASDPKAAGWGYISEAPAEFPHWVGWWCPKCTEGLMATMAKCEGVEHTASRLN